MAIGEWADQRIVEEMYSLAMQEPLTMAPLVGVPAFSEEKYTRVVGDVRLTFTVDADRATGDWYYELVIRMKDGSEVSPDLVKYWLEAFFGPSATMAMPRSTLSSYEARYLLSMSRRTRF